MSTTTHKWTSYKDLEDDNVFSSPIVIIVIFVSVISVIVGCSWYCVKDRRRNNGQGENIDEARRPMNRPSPTSQPRVPDGIDQRNSRSSVDPTNGHVPHAELTGKLYWKFENNLTK